MTQKINVRAFAATEVKDLNTYIVGFYDDSEEINDSYEIQKSLEFDDQDVESGMDTYCLVDYQGRTIYGGIISCVLEKNTLVIQLTDEAAEVFGANVLDFHLLIGVDGIKKVLDGLRRIFSEDRQAPRIHF